MRSLSELIAQVEAAVAALNAAVGEAGFDAAVPDSELHETAIAVQHAQSALSVAGGRLLDRWDARRVWEPGGHRSAALRLSRDAKLSKRTAAEELRLARRLTLMPVAVEAVVDGRLSVDHLDLFARANQPHRRALFAAHEPVLVEECSKLRWAECVRLIEHWCARADAEVGQNGDQGNPGAQPSELYASETLDGRLEITGSLNAVHGEIFRTELDRLERQVFLADQQAGIDRTPAERRALALVEMARRSASTPANARRPKPLLTIHVGEGTLKHLCELGSGTVIRPEQIADYLDDAVIETVLFSGPSTILSVSQQRSFTGTLRRAIEARDRHCQHPSGCDVPAHKCDVDHIVPWSEGGETSQFNGRLQCPTHNRHSDKHDHGAVPHTQNVVDFLQAWRARFRWHVEHHHADEYSAGDDPPTHARAG